MHLLLQPMVDLDQLDNYITISQDLKVGYAVAKVEKAFIQIGAHPKEE